jgi:hypothetical protein
MRRRIEFGWGRDDQDHADGDGMADGERDHLRSDAGGVDSERRHGAGIRLFFLDFIFDSARRRYAQ